MESIIESVPAIVSPSAGSLVRAETIESCTLCDAPLHAGYTRYPGICGSCLYHLAYHEAGHALAASLFGTLIEARLYTPDLAGSTLVRQVAEYTDKLSVVQALVVAAAGTAAQAHYDRVQDPEEFLGDGQEDDERMRSTIQEVFSDSSPEFWQILGNQVRADAVACVRDRAHAWALARIAESMIWTGTVQAIEVTQLIRLGWNKKEVRDTAQWTRRSLSVQMKEREWPAPATYPSILVSDGK